ncbi:DNA polymerase III subunit beta [Paenibacillus harenae]|uniref:DNA polymerase III subunit beta n=1 Tax=Paenibacillus harenae TaxID=306543 RepID=UPI0004928D23|nr:DNA polymerase III subunit beta [Paenibacillus harenae]
MIEISQRLLCKALHLLSGAVSAKNVIPILTGMKLHADHTGLTLTAGHTGMLLQYKFPADDDQVTVRQPGSIVIPARYLTDIIRHLPAGTVSITSSEDYNVIISAGNAVYRLCGMSVDEYPSIAGSEHSDILHCPNLALKKMIKQVSFAVSTSEARPVLTGVSCRIEEEQVRLVASDGVRLASRIMPLQKKSGSTFPAVIIPGKHLTDFSKMLHDEQASTAISLGRNTILFQTNSISMQSSLLEGSYPSTDKLAPEAFTTEMTVNTFDLLHALERVSLLAGDNKAVKLSIESDQTMELTSRTAAIGEVTESIAIEALVGEKLAISFNGKYMLDIVGVMDCGKVHIRLTGRRNPIIVQPADSSGSLYIVTPMLTRE